MTNYFQIFLSLFSILNPIFAISYYLDITKGLSIEVRKKIALVSAVTVFAILTGFLFIGQVLLDALGVHDYSMRLAGGLIILLNGIVMIIGNSDKDKEDATKTAYNKETLISFAISPIALPLIVGPGGIILDMLYGQSVHGIIGKIVLTLIFFIISIIVYYVLNLADFIAKVVGKIGILLITKVMGLIIASVAVEMMVDGLKGVIPMFIK